MKYLWEEGDKLIAPAGKSGVFVVMEVLVQDDVLGKAAVAVDVMDFTPLLVGEALTETNGQIVRPSFLVELPATWMQVDVDNGCTTNFITDKDYGLQGGIFGYGHPIWILHDRLPDGAKFWSTDGQVHIVKGSAAEGEHNE